MKTLTPFALAIAFASAAGQERATNSPSPTAPRVRSLFSKSDRTKFLKLHDNERKLVGNDPLTWSDELASYAQEYANRLGATGEFKHDDFARLRKLNQGENLYWGVSSRQSRSGHVLKSARFWAVEKIDPRTRKSIYEKGLTYTDYKNKYPGKVFGHWTQMIWRKSTKVGAGIARIRAGRFRGGYVVVARYNPAGNNFGEAP